LSRLGIAARVLFGRRLPRPDPEALLAEIGRATVSYMEMDRFRDFRALFLDDERGRRVLSQIMDWGHVWHTSKRPTPGDTEFAEGERSICLRILAAMHFEPTERQTRAHSVKPVDMR